MVETVWPEARRMDHMTSQGRFLPFDQASTSKFLHFIVRSDWEVFHSRGGRSTVSGKLRVSDSLARPTLTFKISLFDKVIVTSEMRLCKLNYNTRVKNNRRHLFCAEEVAGQREALCEWAHWVIAHSLSPRHGGAAAVLTSWAAHTSFTHSCHYFYWAPFTFQTLIEAATRKDSCLSKITLLPNGRTDSKLSEPLIRDPSSLSLCTYCLRDCILPHGLEYLLYGDDCRFMFPVQTSPLTSQFLFPAASQWTPLGGLGGPSNLASPRPNSWWLPTLSAFCLSLPHLRKWQHRFSLEPWKRPVTSHLTQDKETKSLTRNQSLSVACVTLHDSPLPPPHPLCSSCAAFLVPDGPRMCLRRTLALGSPQPRMQSLRWRLLCVISYITSTDQSHDRPENWPLNLATWSSLVTLTRDANFKNSSGDDCSVLERMVSVILLREWD